MTEVSKIRLCHKVSDLSPSEPALEAAGGAGGCGPHPSHEKQPQPLELRCPAELALKLMTAKAEIVCGVFLSQPREEWDLPDTPHKV